MTCYGLLKKLTFAILLKTKPYSRAKLVNIVIENLQSDLKMALNWFNPFSTNVPPLYPLKRSENLRFSGVFGGYRSGTLVENGLRVIT